MLWSCCHPQSLTHRYKDKETRALFEFNTPTHKYVKKVSTHLGQVLAPGPAINHSANKELLVYQRDPIFFLLAVKTMAILQDDVFPALMLPQTVVVKNTVKSQCIANP